jgi:hypothetical protein
VASQISKGHYSDYQDVIESLHVLLAVAGGFFALFCTMWIPDLIGIVKGRFANGANEWPALIKLGLPEWKFTKKHLVFIALLAVLEIVIAVTSNIPILPVLLAIPALLCGVFFGPLWGTAIAGELPLIIRGLPLIISNLSSLRGPGPAEGAVAGPPLEGLLSFFPFILLFLIIGCIVRRCNPKIRASWKLLPFLGALIAGSLLLVISFSGAIALLVKEDTYVGLTASLLLSAWITAFVSGYIIYGIPKIRASWNKLFLSNKIAQGLFIGIAVFVGRLFLLGFSYGLGYWIYEKIQWIYWGGHYLWFLIESVFAGIIGAFLLPALAKKGLLLGPFVKEGEQAQGAQAVNMKQAKEKEIEK